MKLLRLRADSFGALKGEVFTTAAFFEPLPPDEIDAWER